MSPFPLLHLDNTANPQRDRPRLPAHRAVPGPGPGPGPVPAVPQTARLQLAGQVVPPAPQEQPGLTVYSRGLQAALLSTAKRRSVSRPRNEVTYLILHRIAHHLQLDSVQLETPDSLGEGYPG